ncbi:MAG: DHA2 family efflux MFS transporter permease subunit [Gammaproteobacteria bacterium]
MLASSLAFVDGSVINVGLAAIRENFSASGGTLTWIINGYLLPLSALLLLGGALGDRYGRQRLLLLGVGVFAVASVLCSAAGNIEWLVAGRVLQGVGAALLLPNSLAILGSTFEGEARGRAVGIWAAAGAAAGAVGPVLGGWLIDLFGWRAIFFVNIPLALAAIYLGWRFVPDQRHPDRRDLDLAGATLASLGLTLLTWALTVASSPEPLGMRHWTSLALGLIAFAAFVVIERKRGPAAMLPIALFSSRAFVGLTILTFLLYGALGGLMVLIPYALIELHHYSATAAGAALLPLPIILALTSPTMGRLAEKIGPRLPLSLGPLIVGGGCLLAMGIAGSGTYWPTIFPALVVIALGMAGAVAPLTTAVLSSVQEGQVGVASGFNSAVARMGGLIATALLGAVIGAIQLQQGQGFRVAAVAGAVAAIAAGISAFVSLPGKRSTHSA